VPACIKPSVPIIPEPIMTDQLEQRTSNGTDHHLIESKTAPVPVTQNRTDSRLRHEIRNSLAIAMLLPDQMKRSRQDDAAFHKACTELKQEIKSLSGLIDQLCTTPHDI
jgi:hypothetical protein